MRHAIHAFSLARCSWSREPAPRPNALASAARAVRKRADKERETAPLFAGLVVEQDPAERAALVHESNRQYHRQLRNGHARRVREARAVVGALHPDHAAALAAEWEARRVPREPAFLLDWLRRRLGPDGQRQRVPRQPTPRAIAADALARAASRRVAHDRRAHHDLAAARANRLDAPPLP